MMAGALGLSPQNWRPAGWNPGATRGNSSWVGGAAFGCWRRAAVLAGVARARLDVSAGIGVHSMTSPILQEVFGGHLIGVNASFDQLTPAQLASIAALAAGFTGLLSLFNIAGRIFWASLSDKIGRKVTYGVFFLLGIVLYSSIPWTVATVNLALFVFFFCIILTMYGGGFATVPAYLSDLFGTRMVGAIHGRLLTAWSTAGSGRLVGQFRGMSSPRDCRSHRCTTRRCMFHGTAGGGIHLHPLVRPVAEKTHDVRDSPSWTPSGMRPPPGRRSATTSASAHASPGWLVTAAWLGVGIPLVGVWITSRGAVILFGM
jgi:MFS family permease